MIYSFNFPLPEYGDEVHIHGKLKNSELDYLKRQGIHSVMFYPELCILGNKGSPPKRFIFDVRDELNDSLVTSLPEPQCSLSQALTLGIRTHLPYSLKEEFRTTGTYHLMAISGLHLSIIYGTLLSLLAFLLGRERPTYLILTFILVWFYALISGMRPPIMRASIMASMILLAHQLGRPAGGLGLLSLAAAVMVGVKPELLWDVSFLLSFSAMVGIITLSPYFQRGGERLTKSAIKEEGLALSMANQASLSLALSLGSILATFPLIAYYFDIVSPISPIATLFALPAILPIVLTSFGVGIAGVFSPFLSQVVGWLAWPFLSYLIVVVKGFSLLPISSFEVEVGRENIILAYYVALFGGVFLWQRFKKTLTPGQ
jgi:competence protein ComEC